jgi:hypothetical protein
VYCSLNRRNTTPEHIGILQLFSGNRMVNLYSMTVPSELSIPTQLTISAQDLYTGVFVYSITVSGKVIVSKKFIIIK